MPVIFESPTIAIAGLALVVVTVLVTLIRRPALPRLTLAMVGVGLVLLALAAGGMTWRRARQGEVLVMVDVSPSTRTATYRERPALERRIRQLVGDAPWRLIRFAENTQ